MTTIVHGGDLDTAMALAQSKGFEAGECSQWLDLSTGINPTPYPLPPIPPAFFHRLPSSQDLHGLLEVAADYYGVPDTPMIAAAPGTALLIQALPKILSQRSVGIVSPTYGDHQRAWESAGANVTLIDDPTPLKGGALVLCHPNNPDGRVYKELTSLAQTQTENGGILIIDEAFCDGTPDQSAVPCVKENNVIVLKSIGKFFGLAGLRLGFAIARKPIVDQINRALGSWAVSGPALHCGTQALSDTKWQKATREDLHNRSQRCRTLFTTIGLKIVGATNLFTLVESPMAETLFEQLLAHKIYVRRFDDNPHWLRIGLPADDHAFDRLMRALEA